uniref:Uncharacterized protein n=1 Tax=Arundo donax TaxID=35708 RepID=A0A0A9HQV0_ARUDO
MFVCDSRYTKEYTDTIKNIHIHSNRVWIWLLSDSL